MSKIQRRSINIPGIKKDQPGFMLDLVRDPESKWVTGLARFRSARALLPYRPAEKVSDDDDWAWGDSGEAGTAKAIRMGTGTEQARQYFDLNSKSLRPVMDKFASLGVTTRRRRVKRPMGDEVNLNAYLGADSDRLFWKCQRGMRRATVSIGIQAGVSGGNKPEAYAQIAANAAVSCKILEQSGIGVQLFAVVTTHVHKSNKGYPDLNGKQPDELGLCYALKHADEPLDIYRVLELSLPGIQRVYSFGVRDCMRAAAGNDPKRYAYGSVLESTPEMRKHIGIDYLIGRQWIGDQEFDTIEGFVENCFTRFGGKRTR